MKFRKRASRPALWGFIEPCLPTTSKISPAGPMWIHEIKHDGYRLMVRRTAAGVRLLTRNGHDWSDRFHRKRINVSTVLAGQKLGIKEVDEGIWLVTFMHYDLGYFDLEQKTLQPLDNPFGPRLSPMS